MRMEHILSSAIESYPLQMPHPGWVEQIPDDYWSAICRATKKLTQTTVIDKNKIKSIALLPSYGNYSYACRRKKYCYNNISWVDGRRGKTSTQNNAAHGRKNHFKSIVGVEITGKDVIPKLIWLKKMNLIYFIKHINF